MEPGTLVQWLTWLKLPAWKIGDRGVIPLSGIQVLLRGTSVTERWRAWPGLEFWILYLEGSVIPPSSGGSHGPVYPINYVHKSGIKPNSFIHFGHFASPILTILIQPGQPNTVIHLSAILVLSVFRLIWALFHQHILAVVSQKTRYFYAKLRLYELARAL